VTTQLCPDPAVALRDLFGFPAFLPGQEEVVRLALAGRDALALMPTGSGKSLPYQLAAMLRPSPTLVVSPLIALMKDQVDKLPPAVAARTAQIDSSLEPGEAARRLDMLAAGELSLLLAAPERLRRRSFVSALYRAHVGLVVIDEVHCVSLWGHDFRPDYFFLRRVLAELDQPAVLGLTATATPETEREIGDALGREFEVVRASVVRPNLRHSVDPVYDEEGRKRALLTRLARARGPAIVYARARDKCERLAEFLRGHGFRARHYHAGMEKAERSAVQEAFLGGEAPVVVATTAFGMGIDKPDIRLVLLYNPPGSLEDYVQMVGRAGRDGQTSDCVLLSGPRDATDLRRFALGDVPGVERLRRLYGDLRALEGSATAEELAGSDGADPRVLVGILEQAGLVRRGFDNGRELRVEMVESPDDAPGRMGGLLVRLEERALERVNGLVRYAESGRCRQQVIAEHFGETAEGACGTCDACTKLPATGVVAFADADVPELPEDVAGAILGAVSALRWPLGLTGLVATLGGSVAAPPSGRRSSGFGVLAAARPGTIKRWVIALLDSGHLERFESDDGYPLLRPVRTDVPPPVLTSAPRRAPEPDGDVDAGLFERLRSWRLETARADGVPAFVVFSDRTLRALAVARPSDERELAAVPGVGPAKLERYGEALLGQIGAA
jgi:ATP-dependent DNA helicase RecQ